MKIIKIIILQLFVLTSNSAFSQLRTSILVDDFKDIIVILKDDPELLCGEIERIKIGFFPTREIFREFKKLGMSEKAFECLKNNLPNDLKFHVINFQCLSTSCDLSVTSDISVETKEAIFVQKGSDEAFRRFGRKQISENLKDSVTFSEEELPTVYLTGIVHKSDSNYTAVVRLNYQNKYRVAGQMIASQDFEFTSSSREEVRAGCKKIAIWALRKIEQEINYAFKDIE